MVEVDIRMEGISLDEARKLKQVGITLLRT